MREKTSCSYLSFLRWIGKTRQHFVSTQGVEFTEVTCKWYMQPYKTRQKDVSTYSGLTQTFLGLSMKQADKDNFL